MTRKKCFSSCRGHTEKECNAPRCKYINSDKTKHCRLSSKYKMKPPECRVTRKIKKSEIIPHSQKVIKRFLLKHRHNKEIPKKSANKIAQFMRRTTQKRRALFLKTICEDSGVCIAFGKESQKIKQFFNHFVEFDFVQPPIKRIGKSSMNGFVNEIQYKKYNYHAYAVLKSAIKQKSDNLAYEYLVGQYINKKLTKFPCFLETYGLYMYVSNDKWTHVKDTKMIQTNVLKDSLILLDKFDISTACKNSKYLAILIQHIKNAETILSLTLIIRIENIPFITRDLLGVLYQIYFPLSLMSSEFTHYDLHAENVLLYTPVKGKYIHYHYHINDNTVIDFRSPYITKIIDYGRSYFKDEEDKISSTELVDDLCKNRDCDPSCGDDYGFSWFDKDINEDNYFLSAYHNNPSHDLRLLNTINFFIKDQKRELKSFFPDIFLNPLFNFLNKVKYGEGINNKTDRFFGTKPNRKSGYPKSINNVTDAEIGLRNILLMPENISMNETEYKIENKLGDLHVYADKNMLFIPYV